MVQTTDIAPLSRTAHRPGPDPQAPNPVDPHDRAAVEGVAAALEHRFGSALTPAVRCEIAQQAIDHYREARVQGFVTILAPRLAIEMAARRLRLGLSGSGDFAEGPTGKEEK